MKRSLFGLKAEILFLTIQFKFQRNESTCQTVIQIYHALLPQTLHNDTFLNPACFSLVSRCQILTLDNLVSERDEDSTNSQDREFSRFTQ